MQNIKSINNELAIEDLCKISNIYNIMTGEEDTPVRDIDVLKYLTIKKVLACENVRKLKFAEVFLKSTGGINKKIY